MPEQLQKILDRVVEWWKKFSNKQRMLLISLTAVVILALVILGVVVSRPSYTTLIDCQNAKEASQVKDLLDGEGDIDYKVTDTTHFEVNKKDENKANWLLGSNNIDTTGFDLSDPNIKDYIDGSFSTTEADKQKLAKSYMEDKLENVLAANDLIDSAKVTLDIPDDDGTLISRMQESSASVSLALNGSMDSDQSYSVARLVATALGNDSTDKITILDQKTSKILFSGADQDDDATVVSDSLDIKDRIKNSVVNGIKDVMVKSGMYSDVQVAPNLDIDMSKVEKAVHNYSHNDGQDQGELTESSEYNSEAKGGQAATPGTDSNDDTPTYVTQDGEITESSVSDVDKKYSPNEEIIKTISNGGAINYDNSSIAVTSTAPVKEIDFPYIAEDWVKKGALICLPSAARFDDDFLINRCKKVVDNYKLYEAWAEEFPYPSYEMVQIIGSKFTDYLHEGRIQREDIVDIADIINKKHPGRESADEIIVYSVGGMPVEDIAWGGTVYRNALKEGIGVELPLWDQPDMA